MTLVNNRFDSSFTNSGIEFGTLHSLEQNKNNLYFQKYPKNSSVCHNLSPKRVPTNVLHKLSVRASLACHFEHLNRLLRIFNEVVYLDV